MAVIAIASESPEIIPPPTTAAKMMMASKSMRALKAMYKIPNTVTWFSMILPP
jgi:hypothetical protein